MKPSMLRRIESVNKELWVVLTLFIIAFILNHLVGTQRMVLSLAIFRRGDLELWSAPLSAA